VAPVVGAALSHADPVPFAKRSSAVVDVSKNMHKNLVDET